PLVKVPIPAPCSNAIYEQAMAEAMQQARAQGVTRVVFGDLFLEDVRRYREEKLAACGMTALFPLWGLDTRALAAEMVAAGLRACLTCVDPKQLDPEFAGRTFDARLLADLPPGVDPCGEKGEFHTFAFAGPMFRAPIPVQTGEVVEREGFFFGSAAIDAYFSWLEHVLVLALPFAGYDPEKDDLVQFIGHSWSAKLKKVWDLSVDKRAAKLYEKLVLIKEKFRNSLAHGGFEKRGETLAVHIQGVGAVPARLSRFKDSIDHGLFPLKEVSFREVCDFLDDVDAHLREGPTAGAMMFIESGLDVAFDEESRDRYTKAMQSDADLENLIEGLSRLEDIEVNMDW
ncbi:MAG: hypothetical protein IIA90_07225, partial [Chloroflexi bacterium]|nr:hypothetical protein [Chloroflexota bacterium]